MSSVEWIDVKIIHYNGNKKYAANSLLSFFPGIFIRPLFWSQYFLLAVTVDTTRLGLHVFFHRPVTFVAIFCSAKGVRPFFCHSQQPYCRNICSMWVRCNSKLYATSVASNHNFIWSFFWDHTTPFSARNASYTSSSPHQPTVIAHS